MDASAWIAFGSLIVALGSLAVAIKALVDSGENDRLQRLLAPGVAQAQSDAAKALKRSAAAEEASTQALQNVHTELAKIAPPAGPRFDISHMRGLTYVLTNVGREPATAVEVAVPGAVRVDLGHRNEIGPGESVQFLILQGDTRVSDVSVQWTEPGAKAPKLWRTVLPPRV